ncbi:MAG: hypothetical protein AAGC65_09890 [Mucilaginibacter sp.]|uniref:hypothetical protein n=1 Tax=Mucilaginibacter sp. TaxID=1882438 RepID=UPI0031B0DCBD
MTLEEANKNQIFIPIKYSCFFLLLYIFIYNPPFAFLPVSPLEILILPALIYIWLSKRWASLLTVFKWELTILGLVLLFCVFREIGHFENIFFRANIFLLLQAIILPYFVISIYYRLKNHNNLLKDMTKVGVIASFITISMLVFPALGDGIRYHLLKTDDFTELISYRSFGLSEGLTFGYGITQGLVFTLLLYYAQEKSKYLIYLPFVLISILFNARIGLFPAVIGLLYFLVIKFNVKLFTIFLLIGASLYFIIFNTELFSDYAKTITWAFDFFTQSSDLVSGNSTGSDGSTFDILFGEMAVLPHDIWGWLIGTGENIFVSKKANSDIGYIIQLHYGGLVYLSFFVLLIGGMMFRLKSLYGNNIRWLMYILLITIIVTNVKGLTISIIPSLRFIMLIYCYLIMEAKDRKRVENQNKELANLSA